MILRRAPMQHLDRRADITFLLCAGEYNRPASLPARRPYTTVSTFATAARKSFRIGPVTTPVLQTAAHSCWLALRNRIDTVPGSRPLCWRVPAAFTPQPHA